MDDAYLEKGYCEDVIAMRSDCDRDEKIQASHYFREQRKDFLDIAYGSHERQKMDLFVPSEGAIKNRPWPLLVFIHGGYWQKSHKNDWAFIAEDWIKKQFACALIGYRLAPEASILDIESDVMTAIGHLYKNSQTYHIDTERVVLSGSSAGAHLASMALTSGRFDVKAAILMSGIYDLRPLQKVSAGEALASSFKLPHTQISPLGRPAPPADIACQISWGELETPVFQSQSKLLIHYWKSWGFLAEQHCVKGADHFSIVNSLLPSEQGVCAQFVLKQLIN